MSIRRFEWTEPNADQSRRLLDLRATMGELEQGFERDLPAGRYKALAFTYLEIAAMMAAKAITHPEA